MARNSDDDTFYSKTRIDAMSHDRTRWFSEREHGLMLQCKCGNRFGIIERSLAAMARKASGDSQTLTVTPEEIEKSISRLSNDGHVVWFREHEILWWVEMADEQEPTDPAKRPNYWNQLRTQLLPKLVNQVRVAIYTRYPVLVSGKTQERQDPAGKLVNQVGLFASLDRDQDRDLDQDRDQVNPNRGAAIRRRDRGKPKARSRRKDNPDDLGVDPDLIDQVIGHFNERRAALFENGTGYRTDSACHRKRIAKATKREKATLADWRERIDRLAEAVARQEFWRPHLTPEHLHWEKNWEKWAHDSSIPAQRRESNKQRRPDFAPGDFSKPENCTNRGIPLPNSHIDPNSEEAL